MSALPERTIVVIMPFVPTLLAITNAHVMLVLAMYLLMVLNVMVRIGINIILKIIFQQFILGCHKSVNFW